MFTLIELPYALNALEPVISKDTVSFHHGKHLQTYVDNLNRLIAGTEYENMPLEEIVRKSSGGVFNNAGQILNHQMYFLQFQPIVESNQSKDKSNQSKDEKTKEKSLITGETTHNRLYSFDFERSALSTLSDSALFAQIIRDFGSFDNFKAEFEKAGAALFGSGWVWLAADKEGKLVITQEANAGNPITKGLKPLLGADVWEHAYYLDYQNRRAAHLAAIWDIINWQEIEQRYLQK